MYRNALCSLPYKLRRDCCPCLCEGVNNEQHNSWLKDLHCCSVKMFLCLFLDMKDRYSLFQCWLCHQSIWNWQSSQLRCNDILTFRNKYLVKLNISYTYCLLSGTSELGNWLNIFCSNNVLVVLNKILYKFQYCIIVKCLFI